MSKVFRFYQFDELSEVNAHIDVYHLAFVDNGSRLKVVLLIGWIKKSCE